MRLAWVVGLGLIASWTTTADAQPRRDRSPLDVRGILQELDENNDRTIERSEVPERGVEAFETLLKHGDADRDGKLTADELRGLTVKMVRAFLASNGQDLEALMQMDADKDGQVSRAEFDGPAPIFQVLDADRDGSLTQAEVDRLTSPSDEPGAMDAAMRRPGAPGNRKEGADAPTKSAPFARERLKAMDKDGDGRISREEFQGRPAMFDRLDVDKDGALTPKDRKGKNQGTPEPEPKP